MAPAPSGCQRDWSRPTDAGASSASDFVAREEQGADRPRFLCQTIPMAAWSDYQEEVAEFFRGIGLQADTNVTLQGVRTSHDIDVVVHSNHVGFNLLWLVECKHWKTAVSKLHVLALREIVSDLGADRGILMAESGFQSGAQEAAQLTNVQLTSLAALTLTASDALGRAQLRALQDRAKKCHERYWDLDKDTRIKYGLRDDLGGEYSGFYVLQIIDAALSSAFRGQLPIIGTPPFGEMAVVMADPKLRAAKTLHELIECLEPMVADLEVRLRQTDLARAINEITHWRDRSALSDDLVPGPARSIFLSNIDPVEYEKTNSYPFSDLTDEIPSEFVDFIAEVRQVLGRTGSSLESTYYDKAHNYVILTLSGYITSAQADEITETGENSPVKYMLTALVYDLWSRQAPEP